METINDLFHIYKKYIKENEDRLQEIIKKNGGTLVPLPKRKTKR